MLRGLHLPPRSDDKLPVFVFPTALVFYSNDQTSHKQVLTVYNPYDIVLRFKVLCTSPKKFSVVESEGSIKPKCCVDLVIRHNDITSRQEGIVDKFRIQIFEHGHKKMLGKKEITAALYPEKDPFPQKEDHFESLSTSGQYEQSVRSASLNRVRDEGNSAGPSLVIVCTAILCICALMLPTQGEERSTRLPSYLVLTVNQKLISAYVLGLITMVLLRL